MPAVCRWTGFRDVSWPMLTNERIFLIQHYQCWQMPRSTEFNIVHVDRQAVFWNSALSLLTETLIFIILHCKIFTKLSYLEIQHCWIFAGWRFRENYIANSCGFFAVWDKSENLHYKSTMPIFWNRYFCVKSFDFYRFSREQRPKIAMLIFWMCQNCKHQQCYFLGSTQSVNTNNAVSLKVPNLPTPAMLFVWNASSGEWS